MIIFYHYEDLVDNQQGVFTPKERAGGYEPYHKCRGAFTIKEGKLIILKSRDEITSFAINVMFIGLIHL